MGFTHFGRFEHYHVDEYMRIFRHTHDVPHGYDDGYFFTKSHVHIDVVPRTYIREEHKGLTQR